MVFSNASTSASDKVSDSFSLDVGVAESSVSREVERPGLLGLAAFAWLVMYDWHRGLPARGLEAGGIRELDIGVDARALSIDPNFGVEERGRPLVDVVGVSGREPCIDLGGVE